MKLETGYYIVSVINFLAAMSYDIKAFFIEPTLQSVFFGVSAWAICLGFAILSKLENLRLSRSEQSTTVKTSNQ